MALLMVKKWGLYLKECSNTTREKWKKCTPNFILAVETK